MMAVSKQDFNRAKDTLLKARQNPTVRMGVQIIQNNPGKAEEIEGIVERDMHRDELLKKLHARRAGLRR